MTCSSCPCFFRSFNRGGRTTLELPETKAKVKRLHYFSVATIFIAHAYGIAFSISGLFFTILLLTLVGKTAATVPSGAIVVLLAAAPQLGLPVEGVALIFAVDFFVNAGRTALNVLGQALTVSVIEKTEGHVVEESKSSKLAVRYS